MNQMAPSPTAPWAAGSLAPWAPLAHPFGPLSRWPPVRPMATWLSIAGQRVWPASRRRTIPPPARVDCLCSNHLIHTVELQWRSVLLTNMCQHVLPLHIGKVHAPYDPTRPGVKPGAGGVRCCLLRPFPRWNTALELRSHLAKH